MTTLNDFNYVDDSDDVMAVHVNNLAASSLRSEYKNVESLSATRTLLDVDTPTQRFDCNGANRDVLMPTANTTENHPYSIVNSTASGSYTLRLRDNGNTTTLITLDVGQSALVIPDGNGGYLVLVSSVPVTNGWVRVHETWTRTGNHTFTVSGDVTATYRKGTKVRYKDGGSYEYGNVASSSYSAPNTTINLFPNNDYAMASATITDTYISYIENPESFPDWFSRTPTLSASGSMTISSSTLSFARFKVRGKSVLESVAYSAITLGGTASTDIRISTVVSPAQDRVAFACNVADGGSALEVGNGLIIVSGAYLRCRRNLAVNFTIAAGAQAYATAEYEY